MDTDTLTGTKSAARAGDSPYVTVQDWSVAANVETGFLSAAASVAPIKATYTVNTVTLIVTTQKGTILLNCHVDGDAPAGMPLSGAGSATVTGVQAQTVLFSIGGLVTIPGNPNQQFYSFVQDVPIGS